MPILRITAEWAGFRGAPGYSNFYFNGQSADEEQPAAHALAVRTFFDSISASIPGGVSINIRPTADNIDETTGNIVGQVDFEAPDAVNGSATTSYSAASGAVVNWNTSSYRNGRRVRGRTFIVPLSNAAYDANGDLSSGALNRLRPAATELVTNPGPVPMVVWSRPSAGGAGDAYPVTSASVPDLGAILRSRRD